MRLSIRLSLIGLIALVGCSGTEVSYHQEPPDHPLITIESPLPGGKITSPLTIKGQARGMWYFEATFPVVLTDWDGLIIAEGYAQAEDEWMTENFVPFSATLTFTKPAYGDRGTLILKKDNPSGLPEHDDAVEIPILFK